MGSTHAHHAHIGNGWGLQLLASVSEWS